MLWLAVPVSLFLLGALLFLLVRVDPVQDRWSRRRAARATRMLGPGPSPSAPAPPTSAALDAGGPIPLAGPADDLPPMPGTPADFAEVRPATD